jgi:hypothetical protein
LKNEVVKELDIFIGRRSIRRFSSKPVSARALTYEDLVKYRIFLNMIIALNMVTEIGLN